MNQNLETGVTVTLTGLIQATLNRFHKGEDTTLTVTDQDQGKPLEDGEVEGGLHRPVTACCS